MIKDLEFADRWKDDSNDVYYFTASKEMLKHFLPDKEFPEAVSTSINIECTPGHLTPEHAYTAVSPTRNDEDGGFEDYDWYDVRLSDEEIMECFGVIPHDAPWF